MVKIAEETITKQLKRGNCACDSDMIRELDHLVINMGRSGRFNIPAADVHQLFINNINENLVKLSRSGMVYHSKIAEEVILILKNLDYVSRLKTDSIASVETHYTGGSCATYCAVWSDAEFGLNDYQMTEVIDNHLVIVISESRIAYSTAKRRLRQSKKTK
jgi:hypothetical protein